MADLDVTKKLDVYHALYRLNLSFAAIVRRCRELEQARVFRPKYLQLFQGFAQELQAEMNQEFVGTLNDRESHDWYRFGKVRQAWEKYLKDPDDVFFEVRDRREQLRRQGKELPQHAKEALRGKKPSRSQPAKKSS
jgi:hypothetical protein